MISTAQLDQWAPRVLSLLRIAAALCFFEVGTMKILHFPTAFMGGAELPTHLKVAGYLELIGGFLLVIGLFVRPVAFILSGEMAFAFFIGHVTPHGTLHPCSERGRAGSCLLLCVLLSRLRRRRGMEPRRMAGKALRSSRLTLRVRL